MTDRNYSRIQTKNLLAKGLNEAWPNATFKVRIKGDSLCVEWEDGPREDEVAPIVRQFSAGSFDGMIDLYEYDRGSVHLYGPAGHGELQRWRWTGTRRSMSQGYRQGMAAHFESRVGRPYNEGSSSDRNWMCDMEKPVALRAHPKQPSPTLDSIFYVAQDANLDELFAARESLAIASHVEQRVASASRSLRI
jgi:hypothetical protein